MNQKLLEAYRALSGEIEAALADRGAMGLSPGQAFALLLVDRSGVRLSELSLRAGISKQAMMETVDVLEQGGSVRRRPDPADARAKVVRLTAKGSRQRAEARRAVTTVEGRLRRRLGERRYEQLKQTLSEVSSGEE
jgi:DNA-binding MarR family transcriptional regulator